MDFHRKLAIVLHEILHLPSCVGVAPLGLELGVLNHSPGFAQARWETLFVKGDTCGGSCGSKIPHQMHQRHWILFLVISFLHLKLEQ